ncbi:MAG: COX aromatic rich motif-containing protein, partial [Acinetobacter sp.]
DPYRPLDAESSKKPVDIQVIAEPYKWVFVYPEQQIATVNEIRFPEQTPVHFHITSDFTMNSFFIPQLAGQIYAMAGMQTHLHVLADAPGEFRGFSANYSGYGFSQMHFKAHSVTQADFDKWVADVKAGKGSDVNDKAVQKESLDFAGLQALRDGERSKHQIEAMVVDAKTPEQKAIAEEAERAGPYPTKPHPVTYYATVEPDLFKKVIDKYMSNYHGKEQNASHANMQHEAAAGE